jgi:hypothetical protein
LLALRKVRLQIRDSKGNPLPDATHLTAVTAGWEKVLLLPYATNKMADAVEDIASAVEFGNREVKSPKQLPVQSLSKLCQCRNQIVGYVDLGLIPAVYETPFPISPASANATLANGPTTPKCIRVAYEQFRAAIASDPSLDPNKPQAVYGSVRERAKIAGGDLPDKNTWLRYVRKGKRFFEPPPQP